MAGVHTCQYPAESSRNGASDGGFRAQHEDLPFEEMSRQRRASDRTIVSEVSQSDEEASCPAQAGLRRMARGESTGCDAVEESRGLVLIHQRSGCSTDIPLDPLLHAPLIPPDLDSQLALLANTAADWQTHDLFSLAGPALPDAFADGTGGLGGAGPGMATYDWPFLGPELDFGGNAFEALNTQAPDTPSFNLLGNFGGFDGMQTNSQSTGMSAVKQEPQDGPSPQVEAGLLASEGPPHEVPDGQPPDSPWVGDLYPGLQLC